MDTAGQEIASKDPIGDVLREIRRSPQLNKIRIPRGQLDTMGEIYEEHGPGGAELYIMDPSRRLAPEVRDGLLNVLKILKAHKSIADNRTIGRYILKTLTTILETGGKDDARS